MPLLSKNHVHVMYIRDVDWLVDWLILYLYTVYSRLYVSTHFRLWATVAVPVSNASSLQTSMKQNNLYSSTIRIKLLGVKGWCLHSNESACCAPSFPRNGQGKFLAAFLRFFGESSEASGPPKEATVLHPWIHQLEKSWDHLRSLKPSFFLALLLQMIH